MTLQEFIGRVIDDGIAAARRDYQHKRHSLRGAIAGFEACRDKNPTEIAELLDAAKTATSVARDEARAAGGDQGKVDEFWWYRCYEAEVEWVANCLSAVLDNEGRPVIVPPTASAVAKAADIINQ